MQDISREGVAKLQAKAALCVDANRIAPGGYMDRAIIDCAELWLMEHHMRSDFQIDAMLRG